jgi:enoyl-CoA hydratase/carnithine racemase
MAQASALTSTQPATQLLVGQDGPVVTLTISNPAQRNALGPEVYKGLAAITERVKTDTSVRAIVLTGADGVFCGGGNLNRLRDNQSKSREFQSTGIDILHNAVRQIRACNVPFIAAVEGPAAGAGFSIALQCDMIFAAEDAKFIMAYVKSGLTPDGGGSAMLGQLLPRQLAFELMALGDAISAQRLHALGVVSAVVPRGEALKAALGAAHRLAAGPRGAIGRIKRLSEQAVLAQNVQLDLERDLFVESLHSVEAKEGIGAFLAKRKPDFSDKA